MIWPPVHLREIIDIVTLLLWLLFQAGIQKHAADMLIARLFMVFALNLRLLDGFRFPDMIVGFYCRRHPGNRMQRVIIDTLLDLRRRWW